MQGQTRKLCAIAVVALATVALAGVPVAPTSAQAGNQTATPAEPATTITVSASGQASGEPNIAVLRIESAATADSPSTASDRLAANTSRLRTALSDAGIANDRIQTIYYSLDEAQPPVEVPGQRPDDTRTVPYRARQGFEIQIENTSRVGELVDVAVANGATTVLGVEFQLSEGNRSQLRQQALEQAMSSARTQAETLGAAESLTIVGVESISAGEPFFRPVRGIEAAGGGAGTTIESGPVTVEVTVTVTYTAESS